MKLYRYLQPSVLASNVSSLCLIIELLIFLAVIPIFAFVKADSLIPLVGTTFTLVAFIGIGCAMISVFQSQTKTTRS